jgi:hypothetical protein
MTECHDLEDHGKDEVVAGGEEQERTDLVDGGPARRKRGNYRGKKKLFDFQRAVELKEAELAAVGRALGPIEFAKRKQAIMKALLSKTSNLKEKEGTEKVSKMMSTYDNKKAPNAHEKITGEDMPPHQLGYFPYRSLGIKKNKPDLMKELGFRNLENDKKEGVRNLQAGILKEAEQARLKKKIALELLARGFQSDGLKIPSMLVLLRQDCMGKSESAGGKYSVDYTKFFFKLCPDLDKTIFEGQE